MNEAQFISESLLPEENQKKPSCSKKSSGCQGPGREGMNRWSTEGFRAVEVLRVIP